MSDMKGIGYQAYTQYLQGHANDSGTDETVTPHGESRKKVLMIVMQFLCQCRPPDRFRFSEFTNLILDAAGTEDFDPQKVAQAFENVEKYLFLLYIMPWKQEYHRIKTYCGFYKSKIESHIPKADAILKLVGFFETKQGLLVLSQNANLDSMPYIAYECFVASVECTIIFNIWQKVQGMRVSLFQVVQIRCKNAGSVESTVSMIEAKFGKAPMEVLPPATTKERTSPRNTAEQLNKVPPAPNSTTAVFRDRLQGHLKAVKKLSDDPDIPFMDEEYVQGDLDDHLMASMQIVSEKPEEVQMKGSQEWSFVREGLEKNYGKKYFDGPRKDILNGQEEPVTGKKKKEYVQVMAKHSYENVPNAKAGISKSEPIRSRGIEQNASYGVSELPSALYPPNFPSPVVANVVPIQRKGSATETILNKDPKYSAAGLGAPRYRTEPIAVRVDPWSAVNQTYPPQLAKPQTNAQENLDNILKYHKQNVLKNTEQAAAFSKSPLASVAPLASIRSQTTESRVSTSGYESQFGTISSKVMTSSERLSVSTQQIASTWECHQCTYRNDVGRVTCDMCSAKRSGLETDSVGQNMNVCGRCTVVNPETSKQCTVCGCDLRLFKTV